LTSELVANAVVHAGRSGPVLSVAVADGAGRRRAETLGLLREMAADASQGHALGREDFGT